MCSNDTLILLWLILFITQKWFGSLHKIMHQDWGDEKSWVRVTPEINEY